MQPGGETNEQELATEGHQADEGRAPVLTERMEMDMIQKPDRTAATNPIYRITTRETAMAHFRANALTRLMTADVC
jgi:hypothetical protein